MHAVKDAPPLKRGALAGFAERFRKKLCPANHEAPAGKQNHAASDFEYCQDRGNASLRQEPGIPLPNSPALKPSRIASREHDFVG